MRQKANLKRIEQGIFEETGHLSEEYYEKFIKKYEVKILESITLMYEILRL